MEKDRIIRHLCSRGHRGSTTENEQWAAREIHELFRGIGLSSEIQEFRGLPTFGMKLLVHLFPALMFAFLPLADRSLSPVAAAGILLFIASFLVESLYLVDVASRILPRRTSWNVLSRAGNPESGERILFVAHHDSQKKGFIFSPGFIDLLKGFASTTSRITPIHISFLSIVALFITSLLLAQDPGGDPAFFILVLHTLIMVSVAATILLVLEWTMGTIYVPGANDNASGVAVLLDLAEHTRDLVWAAPHDSREFWFLSSGCEETGLSGALSFIARHEEQLREKPTKVICLDGFGYGDLHYFTADGILLPRRYDDDLVGVARDLSEEFHGKDLSFVCRVFTDGLAFSTRGFPAITFGSLDENHFVRHYHWTTDTPENVDLGAVERAQDFIERFVDRLLVLKPVSAHSQSSQSSS